MKIGIAGIGGIGSNVARNLAQARVRQLKIVDYDEVEVANLNRQFYRIDQVGQKKTSSLKDNLLKIFPQMEIEAINQKIGPGEAQILFSDCDLVVEGFDDKHLKKMIIEEMVHMGVPMVSACGIAGRDIENVRKKKMGNCHIFGDFTSDQDDHELFPPKITMITAMMAANILDLLENPNEKGRKNE